MHILFHFLLRSVLVFTVIRYAHVPSLQISLCPVSLQILLLQQLPGRPQWRATITASPLATGSLSQSLQPQALCKQLPTFSV